MIIARKPSNTVFTGGYRRRVTIVARFVVTKISAPALLRFSLLKPDSVNVARQSDTTRAVVVRVVWGRNSRP